MWFKDAFGCLVIANGTAAAVVILSLIITFLFHLSYQALVEGLELGLPVEFSVKTVAENGTSSETVSATFNDTIKGSLLVRK